MIGLTAYMDANGSHFVFENGARMDFEEGRIRKVDCDGNTVMEIRNNVIMYNNVDPYHKHDMEKHPDDIPKEHEEILLWLSSGGCHVGYYDKAIGFCDETREYGAGQVKAWQYIEPYEGGKDDGEMR